MLPFHLTENQGSLWHKPWTVQDAAADSGGREGNAWGPVAQGWSYAGSNVAEKVWQGLFGVFITSNHP